MRNLSIISICTLCLLLASCGNDSQKKPPTPAPTVTEPAPVVETPADIVPQGNTQFSETTTIANITLNVKIQGSMTPNSVLDIGLVQTTGRPVRVIRVWVGDKTGVGSMKTKAHSHGSSSHVHAQSPAILPPNCALWIEIQTADGQQEAGRIELN